MAFHSLRRHDADWAMAPLNITERARCFALVRRILRADCRSYTQVTWLGASRSATTPNATCDTRTPQLRVERSAAANPQVPAARPPPMRTPGAKDHAARRTASSGCGRQRAGRGAR